MTLARAAHLLAPTQPPEAVVDILHSRVADDQDWGKQVAALRTVHRRPRLLNCWPPPDLPDPALLRVLTGHTGKLLAAAMTPDGSWLATGSDDRTVRIWDTATGQTRIILSSTSDWVAAIAIAPDGRWLATCSPDGILRIWDSDTWETRATSADVGIVAALAVAPDGSGWPQVVPTGRCRSAIPVRATSARF